MSAVTRFQILRGTTAQRTAIVPLISEFIYDTDDGSIYVGDGITAGGNPISTVTPEAIQDIVGAMFLDTATIDFTYNDPGGTMTADLTNTTVTPGSYGSGSQIPSFTVDAQGRLTAAANNAITSTSLITRNPQTTNYTLIASDNSKLVAFTGGSASTFSFTAAATLGAGWFTYVQHTGTGEVDLTLDPNGAELIDGIASYVVQPGDIRLIVCDGTAFYSLLISGGVRTFTGSGAHTLNLPPRTNKIRVEMWAAGGGGGSGRRGSAGSNRGGGIGGGGGAYVFHTFKASDISTPVTITLGAGGTGGTAIGADSTDGNAGTAGGNSTFGAFLTAYGGAGGPGGTNANQSGAGGGGAMSAGSGSTGGDPAANVVSSAFGGGSGNSNAAGGASAYGGAAGGGGRNPAAAGGSSLYGGSGGGCGGQIPTSNVAEAGAAGGSSIGLSGGGGAAGGVGADGSAGTAGPSTTGPGTAGGGGGASATTPGVGGAGGVACAGGGGGATLNGVASGAGGNGGAGYVRVTYE